MKSWCRFVFVGCGLLVLASCVEDETELVLKSDGRGAVRNVVRLGELASVMMRLGEAETEQAGVAESMRLCDMLESAEKGTALDVTYELPVGADPYRVCVRTVRVQDWRQGLGVLLGGEDEGVVVEEAQGGVVVRHDGGWMYEALLGSEGGVGALCEGAEVEDVELCRELVEASSLSSAELEEIWPLFVSELDLAKKPMRFRFSVEGDGVTPLEGLSEESFEREDGSSGVRYVHEQVCDMEADVYCTDMIKATKWSFRVALPD